MRVEKSCVRREKKLHLIRCSSVFRRPLGNGRSFGDGVPPLWFDGFSVNDDGCKFEVVSFAVVGVFDFGRNVVEGGGE